MGARGGIIRRGETKNKKDWRDHPLAIAGIVAAASISLTASVGIPLVTGHLNDQVEKLRTRTADQAERISTHENRIGYLEAELRRKDAAIADSKKELTQLSRSLSEARAASPFHPGSPYPRGLEPLQIGMSQTAFADAAGTQKLSKFDDEYWSIDLDHPIFKSVTGYFDLDKPRNPVWQFLFFMRSDRAIDDGAVERFLLSALGRPLISDKAGTLWRMPTGEVVSLEPDHGYMVSEKGIVPRWVERRVAEELRHQRSRERRSPETNKSQGSDASQSTTPAKR